MVEVRLAGMQVSTHCMSLHRWHFLLGFKSSQKSHTELEIKNRRWFVVHMIESINQQKSVKRPRHVSKEDSLAVELSAK